MFLKYNKYYLPGNSITSEDSGSEPPKLIMVFFIGGCTFAEISALRFLSQQEDCKCCTRIKCFYASIHRKYL